MLRPELTSECQGAFSHRAPPSRRDPAAPLDPPEISVVVAARNASATLGACLEAVCAQAGPGTEVIVVDDCSRDGTAKVAAGFPVTVARLPTHGGVAAARNHGVRLARAPLLLFLDADVVPAPGTLARALGLMSDPALDGAFGSYDDEPAVREYVSLFKNLAHHHFHQREKARGAEGIPSFWGACGLIRRDAFVAAGGFDERRFVEPSVEDIDLGWRLHREGARVRLDPDLQVKHLKRWTLASLIATDVLRRAIPWTRLSLERGGLPRGLNLSTDQRLAALVAVGLAATVPLAVATERGWIAVEVLLFTALWINRDLYTLFARKGGVRLAVSGFLLQQLYYLYATAGLLAGLVLHVLRPPRGGDRAAVRPSVRPVAAVHSGGTEGK